MSRRARLLTLLLTCLAVPAVPADAATAEQHVRFPADTQRADATAVDVGDVDGDGAQDAGVVFVPVPVAAQDGPPSVASLWVLPASAPGEVDLGRTPQAGLRIGGLGLTGGVTGLGDVDGDGRGDLAVAHDRGVALVLGRGLGSVDLAQPGPWGRSVVDLPQDADRAPITELLDAGDVNGDGAHDVAWPTADALVVRSTAPGGDRGFRVALAGRWSGGRALGDLDGDGRGDLLVSWLDAGGRTTLAAVLSPAGTGAQVDVDAAVAARRAWVLTGPGRLAAAPEAVGDRDGDGRTDLALAFDASGRHAGVAQPALGTRGALGLPAPDQPWDGGDTRFPLRPVGDQDGDGLLELARRDASSVALSTRNDIYVAPRCPAPPRGRDGFGSDRELFSAVSDRDGDGRPELVGLQADPVPGTDRNWQLDLCPVSFGDFVPGFDPPAFTAYAPVGYDGGRLRFTALVRSGSLGNAAVLAGEAAVVVLDPQGRETRVRVTQRAAVDGQSVLISATATAKAVGLSFGQSASWAPLLQVGDVRAGGLLQSFVVGNLPFGTTATGGFLLQRGTRKDDLLVGTARRDDLRGARGDEVLRGAGAADRLDGGPGRDRLLGGAGADRIAARDGTRDRIACGAGDDVAVVDRRDVVSGCERVRRPR